tara:strand:- start:493 stop:1008 length:516 start_codon:yes stop_codon:yes gene_type:complete
VNHEKKLLILFFIPLITFSQETKTKKLDHPDYSIEYPKNWILDESGKEGESFVIYPKIESEKVFVENINLIKQNLGQSELTIKQLKSIIENQVSNILNNPKIISSEIANKNGLTYHKILVKGEASGMNFQTKVYTFLTDTNLYTLTLVSKLEDYDKIKIVSDKIMDSFSVK